MHRQADGNDSNSGPRLLLQHLVVAVLWRRQLWESRAQAVIHTVPRPKAVGIREHKDHHRIIQASSQETHFLWEEAVSDVVLLCHE